MTHNFVVSYIYDLPFQKLTSSTTGPLYKFLNGWQVAGITRFTTGIPVTIGLGGAYADYSLVGDGSVPGVDEPNYDGTPIQFSNPRASATHSYFSTSHFSPEPLGSFGTANQQFFHGPGINNWDLSLHKYLPINERLSTEFRAELFNGFNHAQFSSVDGYFGTSLFGTVSSARSPRIGQLGLRFNF
jgi:hypothetical protein